MVHALKIDFVSDVACPWCVVGLLSLLSALERLQGEVAAELRFHPFELNPNMPPEGENVGEHIQKKYGSSAEQSAAVRQTLVQRGAELGFAFNYSPESRIWNTFDAHRLLHWAALEGRQLELKQALFTLTFTGQQATSDHLALIGAVAAAELDVGRARDILSSDEFASDVRNAEDLWRSRGINAVPAIIFQERWMIQGGQPPETFERAIRDIISGAVKAPA